MLKIGLISDVGQRLAGYKAQSLLGFPQTRPLSLTVSITQKCNSQCKTCNIWKDPRNAQPSTELTLEEYDKIFRSIGSSIIWYTLSGGEPFLRKDIAEIVSLIIKHSRPKVLIIPTNGLLSKRTVRETERILKMLPANATLIVNLSLDGIGEEHDEIRGIPGNFKRFLETFAALKELKKAYPHSFELGVHSVVSRFNVENILELFDYVKNQLVPDSYICEIAENREELLNVTDSITPSIHLYEKTIRPLQNEIRESLLHHKGITSLIQAFRLKYYDYVITEMREKRRIIPCYAGRVSAQISPWGDVWPCCILAYQADMGNLRDFELDFNKLWYAEKAARVRNQVFKGDCYCPMANVHYTNMTLTPKAMMGVMGNYLGARMKMK
ncbi:Radical SAM domain protein [Syntrophobotulus glycolicus DSM 8271]|uniref:Radical SAM domain protein n=1 Tax=Syntrophobotulus glycolicus (strain DSM 8271 / FlGlyR) TaxID=645991 RepID=F0T1U4_SYNGF|nr:radical SAM protein [Syntrophobotulus glycolicus]ADY55208.1 Radical SAM domain protein [Syntrophobotulus glycolicus DSM 8271]